MLPCRLFCYRMERYDLDILHVSGIGRGFVITYWVRARRWLETLHSGWSTTSLSSPLVLPAWT